MINEYFVAGLVLLVLAVGVWMGEMIERWRSQRPIVQKRGK